MTDLSKYHQTTLGLLRIAIGLVFLNFGLAKIFHFAAGDYTPPIGSLSWIAGLIELVGGALLLVGFKTRIVAFVLSGLMACAYFIAHFPVSIFPTINGGAAAAVFAFVCLNFVTAGAGRFSVDGMRN
ncbi:DoxX family protein [Pseudogemmobacter bohemicus]|uniref:DoxX family protein n=1 Tax=Pseudogemmobacter bohemicus TaxID=2250708 RepID=UPI000DD4D1E5|nr:DoxX family protein [Pseudogemmobacter bohemicus]